MIFSRMFKIRETPTSRTFEARFRLLFVSADFSGFPQAKKKGGNDAGAERGLSDVPGANAGSVPGIIRV
jgi:hypothetical protein